MHVSCLPQSVAANFINALDDDVFWDEEKLKDELVEQFHDGELDDLAKVDILSTMRDFQQGDRDVFWYSHNVLRTHMPLLTTVVATDRVACSII